MIIYCQYIKLKILILGEIVCKIHTIIKVTNLLKGIVDFRFMMLVFPAGVSNVTLQSIL